MRVALLVVALVPFLVYAWRDNVLHLRARKVSRAENLLHLLLGVALVGAISSAFRGDGARMLAFLLAVVAGGAVDEFGFHHDLPEDEHSVHAKEHFAFFGWVVVVWAVDAARVSGGWP